MTMNGKLLFLRKSLYGSAPDELRVKQTFSSMRKKAETFVVRYFAQQRADDLRKYYGRPRRTRGKKDERKEEKMGYLITKYPWRQVREARDAAAGERETAARSSGADGGAAAPPNGEGMDCSADVAT